MHIAVKFKVSTGYPDFVWEEHSGVARVFYTGAGRGAGSPNKSTDVCSTDIFSAYLLSPVGGLLVSLRSRGSPPCSYGTCGAPHTLFFYLEDKL